MQAALALPLPLGDQGQKGQCPPGEDSGHGRRRREGPPPGEARRAGEHPGLPVNPDSRQEETPWGKCQPGVRNGINKGTISKEEQSDINRKL